jgi:hypothetical protein
LVCLAARPARVPASKLVGRPKTDRYVYLRLFAARKGVRVLLPLGNAALIARDLRYFLAGLSAFTSIEAAVMR